MNWIDKLGKDRHGSRPRCVMLCDGENEQVALRLAQLVGRPEVEVSASDHWYPQGRCNPEEIQLDKVINSYFLPRDIQKQLQKWWLIKKITTSPTPKWDIASTCRIEGKKGLLLIEAKAHSAELTARSYLKSKSENSYQIERAIKAANEGLEKSTGLPWNLTTHDHYQISNRFAWSWKLASLKFPVVLIYLGFLDANDMKGKELFNSEEDWRKVLSDYCKGVVPMDCLGKKILIEGTPILPLIKTYSQPFYSTHPELE